MIVDDVQWADDASAQFLHYFARQAASVPLLSLCAYRDEELDSRARLAELVASLRREPHARHMPLARLRLADTKELLDGPRRAPELAARLQRETDGNAFFLTSMLHALREGEISGDAAGELPLPEALRASVRARLAHVPAEARSDARRRGRARPALRFRELVRGDARRRRTTCWARSKRSCGGACCVRSP